MAFTPRAQDRETPDRTRGSNLMGVRAYNERLILSLVRRRETLSKAEISRVTGLSAQTVSVIVRALEADGLIARLPPQRGRVGQPSVPLRLDKDGAFSFGLKVGRRSADLVLMDFMGGVRQERHWTYRYPEPEALLRELDAGLAAMTAPLGAPERTRIAGIGIATPFEMWNWAEAVGAPASVLAAWRTVDLQGEIAARVPYPVFVQNDATAACGAELTFGNTGDHADFVYFFVGSFVGGGIVIGRSLYAGRTRNAGALGSMPIPGAAPGTSRQLIAAASLVRLEEELSLAGQDPSPLFTSPTLWQPMGPVLDRWIADAAGALAHAIVGAMAVLDFGAAIVDGAMPPEVRARLVEAVRAAIGRIDRQGLSPFAVLEGSVGANARAIGAASLPLLARYLVNRDVLLKDDSRADLLRHPPLEPAS